MFVTFQRVRLATALKWSKRDPAATSPRAFFERHTTADSRAISTSAQLRSGTVAGISLLTGWCPRAWHSTPGAYAPAQSAAKREKPLSVVFRASRRKPRGRRQLSGGDRLFQSCRFVLSRLHGSSRCECFIGFGFHVAILSRRGLGHGYKRTICVSKKFAQSCKLNDVLLR